LISSGKKQISPFLNPLEKFWKNPLVQRYLAFIDLSTPFGKA